MFIYVFKPYFSQTSSLNILWKIFKFAKNDPKK